MGRVKVHAPGGESGGLVTGTYTGTGGIVERAINVGFRPTRVDLCGTGSSNGNCVFKIIYSDSSITISVGGVGILTGENDVKITDSGFNVGSKNNGIAPFNVESQRYLYTAFK